MSSNIPALALWQACRRPMSYGMAGAVPEEMETPEIETVARIHKTELTPTLLRQIRFLDQAYVGERIAQLNKKSK